MSEENRILDIFQTGSFNDTEIEKLDTLDPHSFKSWEFWQILHYTNEELYYLSGETFDNLISTADETIETKEGIILCFK